MAEESMAGTAAPKFKRIVLKLSGEALGNREKGEPIDGDILQAVCQEVKDVHALGVQIGLVVGGGNIFRGQLGAEHRNVDRTTGDHMGMLATTINGLALMDCLEKLGVEVRVQTAIPMEKVAEPYILRRAVRHLEKGRVVIFVAGTGNPYFSTDTTAALRGSEIDADVIMKATKVDGVYDKDPMKFDDAVRFEQLSFAEALNRGLKVMDRAAFALCMENNVPILVFSMNEPGSIRRAVCGEDVGTLVHESAE
ncbi:MAG: UMP kinase [Verrucomicrobiota bacterium]